MTLLDDTSFWAQVPTRELQGWVFNEITRYDPTRIVGVTPTGKSFTVTFVEGVITFIIAGRTKTINRAKSIWENGDATWQAFDDTLTTFPANQR